MSTTQTPGKRKRASPAPDHHPDSDSCPRLTPQDLDSPPPGSDVPQAQAQPRHAVSSSWEGRGDQRTSSPPPEKRQLGPNDTIMLQEGEPTGFSIVEPDSELYHGDGRTYHGYDAGKYFLPNDGKEQDRLDLQHALCHLLLRGQFGWAPFAAPPRRVLDVATGTGIWALEFAREHPGSRVVGTDLSLIQPQPDVPNCEFVRENSETADWIFPEPFDYVHVRFTTSCFDDPLAVLRKAWDHLRPGGWLELLDPSCEFQIPSDPGGESALARWIRAMADGYAGLSRDPFRPTHYAEWLKDVGFLDVKEHVLPCPVSPWPQEPDRRQIGRFWRADMKKMLEFGKFWEAGGYSDEQRDEINQKVRTELDEAKVEASVPFYEVYGRKPLESEMTDAQKVRWEATKKTMAQADPSYPTPP